MGKKPTKLRGIRVVKDDGLVRSWASALEYNDNLGKENQWKLYSGGTLTEDGKRVREFHMDLGKLPGYRVKASDLALLPFADKEAEDVLNWLQGDLKRIFATHESQTHKNLGLVIDPISRDAVTNQYLSDYTSEKNQKIASKYLERMFNGSMSGSVQQLNKVYKSKVDGFANLVETASKHFGKDLVKYTGASSLSRVAPYRDFYNLIDVFSDTSSDEVDLGAAFLKRDAAEYGGKHYQVAYELSIPKGSIVEYESPQLGVSDVVHKRGGNGGSAGANFEDLARVTAVLAYGEHDGIYRIMYTDKNGRGELWG